MLDMFVKILIKIMSYYVKIMSKKQLLSEKMLW